MHHEAAITVLETSGSRLEIVLASESKKKWSASLTFDVREALSRQPAAKKRPDSADRLKAARAKAKAIDPKSLNEALRSAAHGDDVAFVNALLEAGADPKNASDNGWTALMLAATYGSAEIVDVLIEAGSDVNACDKNCGGQPVLVWAVGTGKESTRKLRSLLKAGADKNRTSSRENNALMQAARIGDLPAVELLLQEGLRPSHRDMDGETPLIAAARCYANANVMKALVKAGADVNAADLKGMTALMYAAEDAKVDAVKTLLDLGVSPNAKNKDNQTSLQIAATSKRKNSKRIVELLQTASKK
jgi:ankyrin repeat protein